MPAASKSAKIIRQECDVVGLGFRLKRDVRRVLADNCRHTDGIDGIMLVREQENRFDINAIQVLHPKRGLLAGKHLGYLRADTAAILAPLLDDGHIKVKSAKLMELYEADDFKTGLLAIEFLDLRK